MLVKLQLVFQWRLYWCKAQHDGNIVVTTCKNNDIKFLYNKNSYDDLIVVVSKTPL